MGRRYSVRTLCNYAMFAALLFLGYKYFFGDEKQKPADPFRGPSKEHPKNIKQRPVENTDEREEAMRREKDDDVAPVKMDVGDIPKYLVQDNDGVDDLTETEKDTLPFQRHAFNKTEAGGPMRGEAGGPPESGETGGRQEQGGAGGGQEQGGAGGGPTKKNRPLLPGEVDWELEEEMKKRRAEFFKNVKHKEEHFEPDEFKNFIEAHDDITFVTAGSHSTYYATIQFIYSVQFFYPRSHIAIYDIGLTSDEKAFIKSLCNTEIGYMLLQMWPENLFKMRQRVWRPLLLQFAAVKYGHFVYVEPGRFIYRQLIKDYLERSRIHGIIVGGKQFEYSTSFVTSPHMYSFLATDEKRLKKTPHFELTLLVMHNTKRVQHFFMRYLTACTMEEYCIAPPGAQPKCDKYVSSKNYGRCHRYDESAINLILNKWHNYSPKEYFMKDLITQYYDGNDMTTKVKVCNENNKKGEI